MLASLAAILLVPSPAFRSMAFGIMLSVVAVLAATLTLLPAVLGRLGTRINKGTIQRRRRERPEGPGPLDRTLQAWGRFLWRHPFPAGAGALLLLLLAASPIIGMRTNMPSITIIPATANARIGYGEVVGAFGPGAPGTLQVLVPAAKQSPALTTLAHSAGVAATTPGPTRGGWVLDQVVLTTGPSTSATGTTIDHLRQALPTGSLVGGAAAENHDLQATLSSHTPIVLGLLAVLGFLLLLIALQAPLIAALGVAITALSVAGAFGIGRLIFQNGFLSGFLGFQPQGFVDAWAPLFFGAMVFGVAMDYTLFMLSAAKERYETHTDPEHAMIGSMRTSGRRGPLCRCGDDRRLLDLRFVGSASPQGNGGDSGHRSRPRRLRGPAGPAAGTSAPGSSPQLAPASMAGQSPPQGELLALTDGQLANKMARRFSQFCGS